MEKETKKPLHFGLELLVNDKESLVNYIQGLLLQRKEEEVMELLTVLDCKTWLSKCKGFNKLYHCIVALGYLHIVKFLVSTFPNEVDVKNVIGSTLLFTSIENKQDFITEFLIEAGADINVINDHGTTLLHLLVQRTGELYLELMREIIINNKSYVNKQNMNGETALHLACLVGNVKAIQLLLKEGAQVIIETGYGKLPLNYAIESPHIDVIIKLLNNYEQKELESNTQINILENNSLELAELNEQNSAGNFSPRKRHNSIKKILFKPLKVFGSAAKLTVEKVLIEDKMIHILNLINQQQELISKIKSDNHTQEIDSKINESSIDELKLKKYRILVLETTHGCSILDQLLLLQKLIKHYPSLIDNCNIITTFGFTSFNACCLLKNQIELMINILPTLIQYTNDLNTIKYYQSVAMKLFGDNTISTLNNKLQIFYYNDDHKLQCSQPQDLIKDLCYKTCMPSTHFLSLTSITTNPTILAIRHSNSIGIQTKNISVLCIGSERYNSITMENGYQEDQLKQSISLLSKELKQKEIEEECKIILGDQYYKVELDDDILSQKTQNWIVQNWK
ncbi:serine/threonine protein kinase ripk4, putative [Entamoeba dispar SAW760]|uniref:Serine/threonine protein kinase ripk4, putative n=1 Tax=Entamoeba dispar (strain ATCC PRA-260 / SAW760) TaxID=370354 RepID=B0ERC1_ENTDS|nr:serine/threonine protein kinase ripk4, putative [Entamoeba dispar SAW760]EDR22912.1 serine/threonine protein kinase ripk4, putative [Entamoeba dispar SAW760]|eukprot:EDR22912.1 serine/threonine protein kinase ripk4, putative [Entamoeba dispar SAW760]